VRRSVGLTELSGASSRNTISDYSQYGVIVTGINRNADATAQAEVRRTYSDANRADTLVTGLTSIDNAVENSRLQRDHQIQFGFRPHQPHRFLCDQPCFRPPARCRKPFNVASTSLNAVVSDQQTAVSDGVSNVNDLSASLAQINLRITTDTDPANNSASLFDQRDTILQKLAAMAILPPASTATKHRFR
jgi:flagellar hook-associated protein 1 FlgK